MSPASQDAGSESRSCRAAPGRSDPTSVRRSHNGASRTLLQPSRGAARACRARGLIRHRSRRERSRERPSFSANSLGLAVSERRSHKLAGGRDAHSIGRYRGKMVIGNAVAPSTLDAYARPPLIRLGFFMELPFDARLPVGAAWNTI